MSLPECACVHTVTQTDEQDENIMPPDPSIGRAKAKQAHLHGSHHAYLVRRRPGGAVCHVQ